MPERARTAPPANDLASAELDAERILEGGAEIISGALRPYAELETVLSARGWKRRLLKQLEQVSALVAGAPVVREALARVRRRAEVEAWSEDMPVLRQARTLSMQLQRITRLARQRLDTLTVAPPDLSFEEALARLTALLRQPVSKALGEGEVLVFEPDRNRSKQPGPGLGGMNVPSHYLWVVPLGILLGVLLMVSGVPEKQTLGWGFLGLFIGGLLLWPVLRSGGVRITSERLLWTPLIGEAQAVRLDSIPDDGVRLDRGQFDLVVTGDRRLRARSVQDALGLMLMLELHRQPPLLGAARSGEPLEDVALLPAKVGDVDGTCVLRPRTLAFIPDGRGPQVLQAVTGKPTSLEGFEPDRVLETLRWLPAEAFDAAISRVVAATGGLTWAAGDAYFVPGLPLWMAIRIKRGEQVLLARAEWRYQAAAERLLQGWKRRPALPPQE